MMQSPRDEIVLGLDRCFYLQNTNKNVGKDKFMEKYSVIYSSRSGNTKNLADQIIRILGTEDNLYFRDIKKAISEKEVLDKVNESSIIFLGFWTDKGNCDEKMQEVIKKITHKKIYLFGTAGFGKDINYFNQIVERVKDNIDKSNQIIGQFMCQGKMPMIVKKRYEEMVAIDPEDQKSQIMLQNFNEALQHPNKEDLDNFEADINKIINI